MLIYSTHKKKTFVRKDLEPGCLAEKNKNNYESI